ncbi:MAG: DUF4388 domain-containing protein [Chitinispirillaceae bacterium]|nr:DUF4388 domain-containing protein [Chitinispirillaceae bacterium]
MVLSGTLREFILADVFQLLAQQKITGKLLLNNNADEGVILFKDGTIVCAYKDTEKFETKLENYLQHTNKVRNSDCKSLFSSYKDDLAGLTKEILSLSLISEADLSTFAEITIEDITCSLFLWNKGSYRFSSIRSVDRFIPLKTSIPVENIVMEAMRRVDEWNRMQGTINDDTIFVKIGNELSSDNIADADPINNPEGYLSQKINGTSPVKELVLSSALSQYKVYETLNLLLTTNRIAPLSDKISKSVQAALEKKHRKIDAGLFSIILSSVITVAVILVVLLLSSGIFKGIIFQGVTVQEFLSRTESPRAVLNEKLHISKLFLRSYHRNEEITSIDTLLKFNLISKKEAILHSLEEKRQSK